MDQRAIFLYLARKGLPEIMVSENQVATLGTQAISYPSAIHSLREAKFAISNTEIPFSEPIHEHDDCDQTILLALDE
jgi:hypothetical protein